MNPLFYLILLVLDFVFWIILVSVIFSWLVAFGIVNMRNPIALRVYDALNSLTEPMYRQIRRFIPTHFGGVDIAPIGVILAIYFIRYTLFWLSANFGL